jgi:hypothetical protein
LPRTEAKRDTIKIGTTSRRSSGTPIRRNRLSTTRRTSAPLLPSRTGITSPSSFTIIVFRLGLVTGESQYADIESRLAQSPVITEPTITVDGDSDGIVPVTDGSSYAKYFTGKWKHTVIQGAGHPKKRRGRLRRPSWKSTAFDRIARSGETSSGEKRSPEYPAAFAHPNKLSFSLEES